MTGACRTSPGSESAGESAPSATKSADAHLRFSKAGEGEVASLVEAAVREARADGRKVVVYEGASWCEPCQRFHAAAAAGQLDAQFPDLTLLEFDADKDRTRLVAAGYASEYIPLFALPGKDGRAAGPKVAGGIKGDGVVGYLAQQLRGLLARGS